MKASNKTMTLRDKTRNIYHLTREEYEKMLNNSITATYKKASNNNNNKKSMLPGSNSCVTTKFQINENIRENLHLYQWKNTNTVVIWFVTIQDRLLHSFVI